jgi:hypothetical protein
MKELMYVVESEVKKWIHHLKMVVPLTWTQNRTKKGFNNYTLENRERKKQ